MLTALNANTIKILKIAFAVVRIVLQGMGVLGGPRKRKREKHADAD